MRWIILLTLLTGCAAQADSFDPHSAAVAAFTAAHGAPSAHCAERAQDLEITFADLDTVHKECESDVAIGCVNQYDLRSQHAMVWDGATAHTIAHEMLHVLLWCELNAPSGDSKHADASWRSL